MLPTKAAAVQGTSSSEVVLDTDSKIWRCFAGEAAKRGLQMGPDTQKLVDRLVKWDRNHDGKFSIDDVIEAAMEVEKSHKSIRQLRLVIAGLVLLYFITLGILFGIVVFGNEYSKDFTPRSDGVLQTKSGTLVQTKQSFDHFSLQGLVDGTTDLNDIVDLKSVFLSYIAEKEGKNVTVSGMHKIAGVDRIVTDAADGPSVEAVVTLLTGDLIHVTKSDMTLVTLAKKSVNVTQASGSRRELTVLNRLGLVVSEDDSEPTGGTPIYGRVTRDFGSDRGSVRASAIGVGGRMSMLQRLGLS